MTPTGEPPPIACSLDAGTLTERIDEWRELVASSVVDVVADATSVRLELRDYRGRAGRRGVTRSARDAVLRLLRVAIELGSDRRTLTLRVPDGAEQAMATFVALLTP